MSTTTSPPPEPTPPRGRGPPPNQSTPPQHIQDSTPKIYEVFNSPPSSSNIAPPSANSLPDGYGQNTAGAHADHPTLSDAVKTVRVQDFAQVHMYPCVRESLLTAFGGGFAVGGVRALLGAPVIKACNWAVGSFCFLGLGAYEFCLQKRRLEKANMKRAVEIIDRKKVEKEKAAQEKREARRRAKEEADRAEEEARKKKGWGLW